MQGERSNRLRQYGAYVILNLHYDMVLTELLQTRKSKSLFEKCKGL